MTLDPLAILALGVALGAIVGGAFAFVIAVVLMGHSVVDDPPSPTQQGDTPA